MTTSQFNKAIARLGLTSGSKITCKVLGISMRTLQRLSSGEQKKVPVPVERLLDMYDRHSIPTELLTTK